MYDYNDDDDNDDYDIKIYVEDCSVHAKIIWLYMDRIDATI